MSGAYRFEWGTGFDSPPPSAFDPIAFGSFTMRDASIDASVRRGFLEGDRRYALPYRLWVPQQPRAAVLLLHGACDYSGAFDAICPEFARRNFAALAFDQRGFWQTATRGRWAGGKRMARDIRAAVKFLRLRLPERPIFVVGESMGGALAVRAGAHHCLDEASGLVLVAPGALACNIRRIAFGVIMRAMLALGARADLVIERVSSQDLATDAAIRLIADPLVLRRLTPGLMAGLLALAQRAVDEAPRVTLPTLTLIGTREDVSPLACVRKLHKRLGGEATLHEFLGGPHMLMHWRERARVLDAIFAWLESRLAAPACAA